MKKLRFLLLLLKTISLFSICYANKGYALEKSTIQSAGDIANNILQPMMIATDLVYVVYLLIGFSFVAASVIKFFERRVNPLGVRVSQVIFLFIAGLFMLILPYLLTHSEDGITANVHHSIFNPTKST